MRNLSIKNPKLIKYVKNNNSNFQKLVLQIKLCKYKLDLFKNPHHNIDWYCFSKIHVVSNDLNWIRTKNAWMSFLTYAPENPNKLKSWDEMSGCSKPVNPTAATNTKLKPYLQVTR